MDPLEQGDSVPAQKVVLLLQLAQLLQNVNGDVCCSILQLVSQLSVFLKDVTVIAAQSCLCALPQTSIVAFQQPDVRHQIVVLPHFLVESCPQVDVLVADDALLLAASQFLLGRRLLPLELAGGGVAGVLVPGAVGSAVPLLVGLTLGWIATAETAGDFVVKVSYLLDGLAVPAVLG
jgi:hypothetical protein